MVVLVVANYATLLGVPAGAPVSRLLPGCYGAVIIGALIWAWVLQLRDPAAYQRIGLDLDAPEPRQSAGGAR
jgi:hypothetical protein